MNMKYGIFGTMLDQDAIDNVIEAHFNVAVENEENLRDNGAPNWDFVFSDVYLAVQSMRRAVPAFDRFVGSDDFDDLLDSMADAYEDQMTDYAY